MKRKTINAIIGGKFNDWISTIEDEDVRKLVEKNSIVTGGCIASMLLNEPVNDFDFYFRDADTTEAVAQYYCAQFKKNPPPSFKNSDKKVEIFVVRKADRVSIVVKSAGIAGETATSNYQYFEQTDPESADAAAYVDKVCEVKKDLDESAPRYRPVFLSSNAITLANGIQLVTRFFGNPAEIHDNYDFVHVTNYWTSWDRKVELKMEALESLLAKELRYMGSKYPICSLIRIRKFVKRGWTINAGQILKMAMQVQQLDLNNPEVLQEQLVGVDMAYFTEILNKLKEKNPDRVDSAYLTEIIDRMF